MSVKQGNQNHAAFVTKLTNVRNHPNADKLNMCTIFGCNLIIGKNQEEGEVGLYFQSGLQLSEKFAKDNDLIRRKDASGNTAGGMFEETRRVKAINLRGEKSDGFFIGLSSLEKAGVKKSIIDSLQVGDYFETLDGIAICNKYVMKTKKGYARSNKPGKSKKYTMFKEHFDTNQLRFKTGELKETDYVVCTEKLHGTSQRVARVMEDIDPKWWQKPFLWMLNSKKFYRWRDVVGTRRVVLDKLGETDSNGLYSDEFRSKAAHPFFGNIHKGETIYYEVVGYEGAGKPIMGRCQNSKVSKDFEKAYGKETVFEYGCKDGEFDIHVYRITMTNEDGVSFDLNWDSVKRRCGELGVKHVPELFRGTVHDMLVKYCPEIFVSADIRDFEELVIQAADKMASGASTLDPTHVREGMCIRKDENTTPWVVKHKSMEFKILEGIVKPDTVMAGAESES